MNIADLQPGSYTPVAPQNAPLNIKDLPAGSYQPVQQDQSPSVGGFLSNAFGSLGNLIGSVGNAVMHPIKTIEGLGNAAAGAGEELSNTIAGTQFNNDQTQAFDQLKSFYDNRYGISDLFSGNLQSAIGKMAKTFYTDPAGAAADFSILLQGGGSLLSKLGEGVNAADLTDIANSAYQGNKATALAAAQRSGQLGTIAKVGRTAADIGETINPFNTITKPVGAAVNLINKGISSAVGVTSKLGYQGANDVINSARGLEGAPSLEQMTAAARGQLPEEDFVSDLQKGVSKIRTQQLKDYQAGLNDIQNNYRETNLSLKSNADATIMQNNKLNGEGIPIKDKIGSDSQIPGETFPLTTQGLKTVLGRTLDNFKVAATTDGQLDFSNSPIPRSDYPRVQNMYDDITNWKDTTPEGIKNLQEKISGYFKPLEKTNRVNAMVTELSDNIKNYIRDKIPEFKQMDSAYSKTSALLKDMKRDLSIGGKAGPETILRKVRKAATSDSDLRAGLIKQLETTTGKDIRAIATGFKAQGWTPHGLLAGGELVGSFIHPQLLAALAFSSPRFAFEFLRGLGIAESKTSNLLSAINANRSALITSQLSNASHASRTPLRPTNSSKQIRIKLPPAKSSAR
jgi:hypothetical protein